MGKGDKRSKKGKIRTGSYGKKRLARVKKAPAPVAAKSKKS
jgi:ribosomal small subunit protein bTHX